MRLASSPKVTSRTWCTRFSIPQCPRQRAKSRAASARERETLVRAYSTSTCSWPSRQVVRVRRQTCCTPGQSRCRLSRVVACSRRWMRRPCSLVLVSATSSVASRSFSFAGGKSRPKLGRDRLAQRRLVLLHHHEVVAAAVDDLLADLVLTEHGIACHDAAFQHDRVQ